MSGQHQRLRGIRVLKAVSSAVRLQILNLLYDRGELSYTELMNLSRMSPSHDAGRFAYHLKFLLKADLVEVDAESKKYRLTDLGKMVLDVAEEIEKKSLRTQKILVRTSRFTLEEFDVNRIVDALVNESGMPIEQAKKIAKEAERRLLKARTRYLTAPLIREVVNGILIEKGLEEYRHKLTRLGLPVHDVSRLLSKSKAFHSATSICEEFGKNVLGEYTLLSVLPRDVADAHLSGELHLDDLGCWILKPSEVVHDLRFFLKGQRAPQSPRSFGSALNLAFNILLHSSKEVGSMQVLEYFNVFLAPFVKGLETSEVQELLRQFILNLSQHVAASLNIELAVPEFLAEVPVASGVYGDFRDECLSLAKLTLEVLAEESFEKPLLNPRVIVKLRPETFKNGEAAETLLNAHRLASEKGMLYFANLFQESEKYTVFSPSGCVLKADLKNDWEIDTLRSGALGLATVNLPRIAYECGGAEVEFFRLLSERLEMATRALEIKYRMLRQSGRGFLHFLGQTVNGDQYFRLENCVRLVNLAGLEEAAEAFTGRSIYESEDSFKFSLETVQYILDFLRKVERRDRRVLSSFLPVSEASVKLARQDIERFGVAKTRFHGTKEKPYYSTFFKVLAKNPEALLKMVAVEKELYGKLRGGSLTVIELGEGEYAAETLLALTRKLVQDYGVAFFTYNRNLTYCRQCHKSTFGIHHKCPNCGSVSTLTFFSRYP